jgi:hypothetical protein
MRYEPSQIFSKSGLLGRASAHDTIGLHCGTCGTMPLQSCQSRGHESCTSHAVWSAWISHAEWFGMTGVHKRLLVLLLFLPPPLFGYGGSIGDSWVFSSIRCLLCPKSHPWVGILVLLGTYVIFAISFCCNLKFSLGWTHMVRFWN